VHLVVGESPCQSIQETGALRTTFELTGVVDATDEAVLGTAKSQISLGSGDVLDHFFVDEPLEMIGALAPVT